MNWLRTTAGLVTTGLAVLVLVLAFLYLSQCSQNRQRAAQGKVDRGQAEAGIDAGAEAGNTLSNVIETDREIDATVKGGQDEVLSQPAGNSNAAAIRAACRLRSYCGDRRCAALRTADPAIAACRNAIGATP